MFFFFFAFFVIANEFPYFPGLKVLFICLKKMQRDNRTKFLNKAAEDSFKLSGRQKRV